ncbi:MULTISPECIES: DUF6210 family protein [Paenibacillus]|uniref:DUF6210 family protein n=1 Tax=Paenibacillus violae TaxID=3077234 RepID=A0ABU3R989_9BACL|nr:MULTISPECIES: DUF6210 family protein [Paenibacillus]MDU0200831.1 DUF6210 family protein [Paenibacillus sp. PFR10]MEC0268329.1 DUF6210 family protein [Paenibacillus anseongense]
MQKNRKVCLYGLEQLALIIKTKSGVFYYNQVGGYSCLQPSVEGILTILDDDTKQLLKDLSNFCLNKTKLTIEDANFLDDFFRTNKVGKFLSIDREKLDDSMEAWLNVIIDIETIDKAFINRFDEDEGILTWSNSD